MLREQTYQYKTSAVGVRLGSFGHCSERRCCEELKREREGGGVRTIDLRGHITYRKGVCSRQSAVGMVLE